MTTRYKSSLLVIVYLLVFTGSLCAGISPVNHLCFRENAGQVTNQYNQARPDVLYSGSDGAMVYHLLNDGLSYQFYKEVAGSKSMASRAFAPTGKKNAKQPNMPSAYQIYRLDIQWLNANAANVKTGEVIPGFDNFYTEAAPKGLHEVKSYQDITYQNIYAGIDLKWYEKNGHLKYDYLVAPGADYRNIQLVYKGAERLYLNTKGDLIIQTPMGNLCEEAPLVFQKGKQLKAAWQITGNQVAFMIEGVDNTAALQIDPVVRSWATYYGGTGYDWVGTVYTDANGNLFVAGGTTSANLQSIATTGAFQTNYGGSTSTFGDCFLVKFNVNGQRQWGTYFGGNGIDFAYACTVDGNGDAYITGGTTTTNSAVMATPGCHQSQCFSVGGVGGDALLAKFNTNGARLWSTYYGEFGNESANGVICDVTGNVYMCGYTGSASTTLIATPGAQQSTFGGGIDGFLVKFTTAGQRLWSTYYGGVGDDQIYNCVTDASGNVYVGGITSSSTGISTPGSHQANYGGGGAGMTFGIGDAFLAKFNAAGVRQWGSYYGGTGDDGFYYCAIDAQANVYFSGTTTSNTGTIMATAGGHQASYGGGSNDAVLVKFDQNGNRLWGSYYGGTGSEEFCCCVVEKAGAFVYLSGSTSSGGTLIATPCAYQNTIGGSKDLFLAKFDGAGLRQWATYYGSTGIEDWSALAVDNLGAVFLSGETTSQNAAVITSAGAHQVTYGGGSYDAFVAKLNGCTTVIPSGTLQACKGQIANLSVPQSCNLKWYGDSLATNFLFQGGTYTTGILTGDTIFWAKDVSCGSASSSGKVKVLTVTSPTLSISASATLLCVGETFTLTAGGATTYTWASVTSTNNSVVLTATNSVVHGVDGSLANGCKGSKTIYITVDPCLGLPSQKINAEIHLFITPNPGSQTVKVSSNFVCNIFVFNELGVLCRTIDLNNANALQAYLDNLPAGIYFVEARNENSKTCSKLIITN